MKICKQYTEEQLFNYWQNHCSPKEVAEMQFHLTQCEQCRANLKAMRTLAAGLLDEDIEKKQPVQFTLKKVLQTAAVVGGVVLLAMGGYWLKPSLNTPDIVPIDTTPLPVYHAGDSVTVHTDSIQP